MQGKHQKAVKNLALGGTDMYCYINGQISLTDFQQSMGMHLREDNRWVKKAQIIPWGKLKRSMHRSFRLHGQCGKAFTADFGGLHHQ